MILLTSYIILYEHNRDLDVIFDEHILYMLYYMHICIMLINNTLLTPWNSCLIV